MKLSAILLSGGVGSRMEAAIPKQYLPLGGKPLVLHSFERLRNCPLIDEVIVVCHQNYRRLFPDTCFADPGNRRQDSLFQGLKQVHSQAEFILVHDAARPLLSEEDLLAVIQAGFEFGAATLALPAISTIKQADRNLMVTQTFDRSTLYTIQTPQVIRKDVLTLGFALAQENDLTVTDDVSLAELTGHPVKLVIGSPENIKITTPEDLALAESLFDERLLEV